MALSLGRGADRAHRYGAGPLGLEPQLHQHQPLHDRAHRGGEPHFRNSMGLPASRAVSGHPDGFPAGHHCNFLHRIGDRRLRAHAASFRVHRLCRDRERRAVRQSDPQRRGHRPASRLHRGERRLADVGDEPGAPPHPHAARPRQLSHEPAGRVPVFAAQGLRNLFQRPPVGDRRAGKAHLFLRSLAEPGRHLGPSPRQDAPGSDWCVARRPGLG